MRTELPQPWGAPNRVAWCDRCEAHTAQFGRRVPGFADLVEDRDVPGRVVWSCRECGRAVDPSTPHDAGQRDEDTDPDFDRS
jgi:hypothetical protein